MSVSSIMYIIMDYPLLLMIYIQESSDIASQDRSDSKVSISDILQLHEFLS